MLDILAEIIIDLIQGKDQKKKQKAGPPKKTPSPAAQRPDGWPEPSASDPYAQNHPSDATPASSGSQVMSVEDVMRRMQDHARRGGADAPVLDPQFHPRQPQSASRERRPRVSERRREQSPRSRPAPSPSVPSPLEPRPGPAPTYAPSPGQIMRQASAQVQEAASVRTTSVSDEFAAKLRGNPAAAREAFVFSEIFGRPLGERM